MHRENVHLKENLRQYWFVVHGSLKECALALRHVFYKTLIEFSLEQLSSQIYQNDCSKSISLFKIME